jgi:hypothetical protein
LGNKKPVSIKLYSNTWAPEPALQEVVKGGAVCSPRTISDTVKRLMGISGGKARYYGQGNYSQEGEREATSASKQRTDFTLKEESCFLPSDI